MSTFIREQAELFRVTPAALTIEVTETAVTRGGASIRAFFEDLRGRGFKVAVDDFGSGNATLRELRGMPFDYLKIDGVLVRDLPSSPVDQELVHAFSRVAHVLGAQVVVEQVEDAETMEYLAACGCGIDYAQGYHLGRPEDFPLDPPDGA